MSGLLYVDDYFFTQCHDIMPISATMLCIFCQICKIPISWAKCELGSSLQWIGWHFHLTSGYIEVPQRKISKLLGYISEMNVHHAPQDGILRNSLGSQCGSRSYGPICEFGSGIGIQISMLFRRRISALTMVIGTY